MREIYVSKKLWGESKLPLPTSYLEKSTFADKGGREVKKLGKIINVLNQRPQRHTQDVPTTFI